MDEKQQADRLYSKERAEAALAQTQHAKLLGRVREITARMSEIREEFRRGEITGMSNVARLTLRREKNRLVIEQVSHETELARLRPFRGALVHSGSVGLIMDALRCLRDPKAWATPVVAEVTRKRLLIQFEKWCELGGASQ